MGLLTSTVALSTLALTTDLISVPRGKAARQLEIFEDFTDPRYPDQMVNPSFMTAKCMSEGFFPHPYNCTWFYRCHDRLGSGFFSTTYFICAPGTEFDDHLDLCIPKSGTCGAQPDTPIHSIPVTVGPDSFMLINQTMTWPEARDLCGNYGQDMYKPIDILAVAEYLNLNFDTFYWLGARGNGSHMVWNTGGALKEDDPWKNSNEYDEVTTDDCLDFYTTGMSSEVGPLVASGCNTQSYVLCGVKNTRSKFQPNRNTLQTKRPKGDQKKTKIEILKAIKETAIKSEE